MPDDQKCRICDGLLHRVDETYEIDNGYLYVRRVDRCDLCEKRFITGPRRFVGYVSDERRAVAKRKTSVS